jgi:DNA-binding response OmpR family regulator
MKKILLVNTSRYFLDEGKNLLDRKDFQVFLAPSALEALQIHRRERVNLIVAELNMPDMGCDALCSRIREDTEARSVSFIMVCNDNPAEIDRADRCGANICLRKPLAARTLLGHVEKLLAISVRRGYRVLLRARVKGAKDDVVFFCTSQNISTSGILIETDRTLLPGEQLTCSFYLPGAAHVTADGEVARTQNTPGGTVNYCGVRFTGLSSEHRVAIERFISETIVQP